MRRGTRDAVRIAADGGPFQLNAIDAGPERGLIERLLRALAEAEEHDVHNAIAILEGQPLPWPNRRKR
jgi:hypothetical protein